MASDHKVCIIMLGESGVGKTSLMLRFCKNVFNEAHKVTLIMDSYNKTIILNDQKIKLELWDTAGEERFKAIFKAYFRNADGVLLAYDMTDLTTFMKLSSWLNELRSLNEEATVLIVGNKSDLSHRDEVYRTTVEKYAQQEGLDLCETSAKNNENVDEVFQKLVLKVLERKKITPFYIEKPNGEIKAESSSNAASNGSRQQTESSSNTASNGSHHQTESTNNATSNGNKQQTENPINAASDSSHQQTENPSNAASDSSHQQTENILPPIIRFEDRFGKDGDVIKLAIEKPKEKQKKGCC